MKYFNITWQGVQYSAPTRLRIWKDGVEYIANPDKAHYIITPNESDVIVYNHGEFLKLNGEKFGDEKVTRLLSPFRI